MSYVAVALLAAIFLAAMDIAVPQHGPERLRQLSAAAGLAVTAAALIGYLLAQQATRSLQEVTEVARRLAAGHLEQRVYWGGGDELGDLAAALNRTAEALQARNQESWEERERLAAVLAHMESGVLLVDARGRVVVANPAARRLLGLGERDVERPHIEVTRNFHLSEAIDEVFHSGVAVRRELTLVHGGERWVEVSLAPIGGHEGRPGGVLAVINDVTERRRLEQLRSDFVANVSHELRTPVTAIQGFAETLLDGGLEDAETCRACVGFIDREARRLSRMVEDLLELARLEARQVSLVRQDLDMVQLARETVERFADRAARDGILLRTELPARRVGAYVDADRIEQVLVNLLDNALKYTPSGGSVTVRLEEVEPEDCVRLSVADTGAGMPPGELDRIFERFYRVDKGRSRQTGGTGLGLAIVKQIVEAHGGSVRAESAPGAGAVFHVSLPRWRPELSRRAALGQAGG